MAFCTMQFSAPRLGKMAEMNLLIPESGKAAYPVLYLLHGYSDNHTAWCRRTSLEWYTRGLDLIVAMPDGEVSFYANDPREDGQPFEDHIIHDVVGFVDKTFPTIAGRTGRAIAGLSMGGYGSMMLALKHPEMFSVVSSHSSAFGFASKRFKGLDGRIGATSRVLRKTGDYDVFDLAEAQARKKKKLHIRFDCGLDDYLLKYNRDFHDYLDGLGIAHDYEEHPGIHNWEYWNQHIQTTLAFATDHLASARARRKR